MTNANGAMPPTDAKRLVRDEVFEAIAYLEAQGIARTEAFRQVAAERDSTEMAISQAYYSGRRARELPTDDDMLKRDVYFERVAQLEAEGISRQRAFDIVADEADTTKKNVSAGYYAARRARIANLTEGGDPAAAIAEAIAEIEHAVSAAKLVIASATMQYEKLRADAQKYADVKRMMR